MSFFDSAEYALMSNSFAIKIEDLNRKIKSIRSKNNFLSLGVVLAIGYAYHLSKNVNRQKESIDAANKKLEKLSYLEDI